MSQSKQEIKDAFTLELKNTPEYQIVLNIKQIIMAEILAPNVQSQVIYTFLIPQTDEQINVIKMCMIIEFGFSTNNISNNAVIVDMINFLL
jgi:hypothetical protein